MGPKRLLYPEETMQAACRDALEGREGLREAARQHGVPHCTLRQRLLGRPSIRKQTKTVLSAHTEKRIVDWLKESARRDIGKTKGQVVKTLQSVLKENHMTTTFKDNKPGRKWFDSFMKRHSDKLSVRKPQALGAQRAAVMEGKIEGWFAQAYKDICEVDPHVLDDLDRIFNCDETGFQLGGGIGKVIAPKKDKRIYQVTHDTHKQVTVLACGGAAGHVLKSLVVFPSQRFVNDPLEGFPDAHFSRSGNGWIDTEIFQSWFEFGFIPEVSHLKKPVLLFVDVHKAHSSLKVSELCRDNNIILYELPSHSSLIVQPLDLTTFKNLKQAWREEVMNYQDETSDTLSKRDFAKVFKKAWQRGIEKDVVIGGFKGAGIYPWNPRHFDWTKLGPSRLFTTEMTDTSTIPKTVDLPTETMTCVETVTTLTTVELPAEARTCPETVMLQTGDATAETMTSDPPLLTSDNTMTVTGQTEMDKERDEVTNEVITEANAIFPLSPNISHPPSPSPYLSALPDLPASPPAIEKCDPATGLSELPETADLSLVDGLDRLLDIVALNGLEKLISLSDIT